MKRLLLLVMVCLLAGCTHDEFNEPIKDSAMPDEIVHRTLSFDEFYTTFSANESLLGKEIQALAQTRNEQLNKSTNEAGGVPGDNVEIMVDYYYDAVHSNETYSFVTKEFKTKGDYLEKFVVTIENGIKKSGYLRYYPEGDKIEELFTGKVELTNASQTVRFSNYFVKGIREERTTYGVQKDCTMVFTFGSTRCSHSGNHEYGESCNRGFINDAYLYVLTDVFCKTTITSDIQEMPNQIIDINPGRTGGGGGTSSSTVKFNNFVNALPASTKSWLLENYDIKLIVSGYLVQQNFSEESKQTATALLNFIVNDNVLKTNNNKLTEHIVRSSLMGSEFSVQQFMAFWSNLTQQEKMILQNYANNGVSVNGNFLKPSVVSFLNWAFPYLINNEDISTEQFKKWFIDGGDMGAIDMSEFLDDLDNPNIIIPTRRFKNNNRIYSIYNKIKHAVNIKQYLQNFDAQFSVAHLVLDVKPFEDGNDANAKTYEPEHYRIEIIFNSNKLNRPWLDIARTMMHEMIHAEMYRILLSLASTNGQIDKEDLKNKLTSHNYPGLYEYYRMYNFDDMQHEQMADYYRNIISTFLKQLDSSLTNEQADAMAWVGLQETTAWNNLTIQQKNNIINIYNSWRNTAPINLP